MQPWQLRPLRQTCRSGPRPVRLTVTRYAYDPDNTQLTYDDLLGIDELVLSGSPDNGTVLAMPSQPALLKLFANPQPDDVWAIDVVNASAYSFVLQTTDPA
jgi:hypothetical protein